MQYLNAKFSAECSIRIDPRDKHTDWILSFKLRGTVFAGTRGLKGPRGIQFELVWVDHKLSGTGGLKEPRGIQVEYT